jgi:DNA-binding CsgD family transcriptional regulator
MGLETGMGTPMATLRPSHMGLPYLLPLLFLPIIGHALDGEKPGMVILALLAACLCVPLFVPAQEHGILDALPLFCLLNIARESLLLAMVTASARLMKTSVWLPLPLALAWTLHFVQPGGVVLRNLVSDLPWGVFAVASLLAAATALCLARLARLLREKPKLWAPAQETAATPDAEQEKIGRFAAAHELTKREQELLLGLSRGASLENLAGTFGVTISTVRFHQTHLLKKTGASSRSHLLRCFAAWDSPPDASPDDQKT